jgi:putative holliday junction resolvase
VTTRLRGRRLGIDVGDARIGVASCDPDGILATPVETVAAGAGAITRLVELVHEYEAVECFVGMPLGLSGRQGPAAAKVRDFAAELQAALGDVPVRFVDERLTTVSAHEQLRAAGRTAKNSRGVVDQAAAVLILQTALDARRAHGNLEGSGE